MTRDARSEAELRTVGRAFDEEDVARVRGVR